jgi:hypothetical protein
MAKSAANITFEPKPLNNGPQWLVVVTFPHAQQEQVEGFPTDSTPGIGLPTTPKRGSQNAATKGSSFPATSFEIGSRFPSRWPRSCERLGQTRGCGASSRTVEEDQGHFAAGFGVDPCCRY